MTPASGLPYTLPELALEPAVVVRFWSKVSKTEGCWEWQASRMAKGYGVFFPRSGVYALAHRFAWMTAYGEIPEGLMVRHACDNPPCTRLDHLCLGTAQDNTDDMVRRGRLPRGEGRAFAKLTVAQVREMRALHTEGVSPTQLADMFPSSEANVRRILNGELWRHVPVTNVRTPQELGRMGYAAMVAHTTKAQRDQWRRLGGRRKNPTLAEIVAASEAAEKASKDRRGARSRRGGNGSGVSSAGAPVTTTVVPAPMRASAKQGGVR